MLENAFPKNEHIKDEELGKLIYCEPGHQKPPE
jgi:hypothetical protein